MSLYIKGLEMPKSGSAYVLVIHPDGAITTVTGGRELPYKAIPVPPHGRLGDLDALAAGCDEPYWCRWLSEIEDAPTIIPPDDK